MTRIFSPQLFLGACLSETVLLKLCVLIGLTATIKWLCRLWWSGLPSVVDILSESFLVLLSVVLGQSLAQLQCVTMHRMFKLGVLLLLTWCLTAMAFDLRCAGQAKTCVIMVLFGRMFR